MKTQSQLQKDIIVLTPQAITKAKSFLAQEKHAKDRGLRVALNPGGCAGTKYALFFDKQQKDDIVMQKEGLKIFVSRDHAEVLEGLEIDYVEGLQQTGFTFSNPHAKHSCGCGNSVSF